MDIRKTLSVIVGFLAGGFFYAGPFISSALSWTIFFCFSIPVYFIWNRAYPLSRLFTLFVSFFVGFLTACVVFSWVTHVSILGAVLLAFYIALYYVVWMMACRYFRHMRYRALLAALAWVLLEYLRGYLLGGFGWALLGYSLYRYPYAIQIADTIGAFGVSFVIMIINVSFSEFCLSKKKWYLCIPVFLVLLCAAYSYGRSHSTVLRERLFDPERVLKITVFQPNIAQELKWDEKYDEVIKDYFIGYAPALNKQGADLVIFPETSWPHIIQGIPAEFSGFSNRLKRLLLMGVITYDQEKYYNTAYLMRQGAVEGAYQKLRLVPFGEYVPLRDYLTFIAILNTMEDMTPGKEMTVFDIDGKTFSVLICFEDIFADLSAHAVRKGAQFLVNITNDAWFGQSAEPSQHLAASVFRAVENRKYMVRAANTGISGFIDPFGRCDLVDDGGIFVSGLLTRDVFANDYRTFYTQYGDYLFFAYLFFFLLLLNANVRATNANQRE